MRVVLQRVKHARVEVNGEITGKITAGLLLLAGFEDADTMEDLEWMSRKIANMRIFSDRNGLMNLSVMDVDGSLLSVSQFTLHASIKKGNRPAFIASAKPDKAKTLYHAFNKELSQITGKKVEEGIFGAMMDVTLLNDGPVTIIIDSKARE